MTEQSLRDRIGQAWAVCKGFLAKRWRWLVGVAIVLSVSFLVWVLLTGRLELGFHEYIPSTPGAERGKTLWDWMDLLFVLLALALGAGLFTWVTNKRERDAEERRVDEQQKIELDRSRDAALQTYLDRVSALLRTEWHESGEGFLEANIIRAQTLTVLRQLDGRRNVLLFRFLRESGLLVNGAVVILRAADLGGTDLSGVNLTEADLSGAYLHKANLRWADLAGADLSGADLSKADLRWADLKWSNLCNTDLSDAKLIGANLSDAFLIKANLTRANLRWSDLIGADLSGAGLSGAGLSGANLRGANLNGANLRGANLRGANLSSADLSGAGLSEANLREADLRGVNLNGANLSGAKLTKEQLAQVKRLDGAILLDGTKYPEHAPTQEQSAGKPEPAPAGTEPQDAEGQTDQPEDLEAGGTLSRQNGNLGE